jgi:hypothetical protein
MKTILLQKNSPNINCLIFTSPESDTNPNSVKTYYPSHIIIIFMIDS